jgi:hypothetical protein
LARLGLPHLRRIDTPAWHMTHIHDSCHFIHGAQCYNGLKGPKGGIEFMYLHQTASHPITS